MYLASLVLGFPMASVYTKSDNEITASVGDSFVIELEGNPTTGYEWKLHFDSDKLKLLDQQFKVGGSVGAGGAQQFKVEALKSGQTTIRAVYKRAWESDSLEEHTFRVKVTS